MVEQAVALCANGVIGLDDILPHGPGLAPSKRRSLATIVDEAERAAVVESLAAFDGNREKAAEALDISATTLWRKMNRLGIVYDARTGNRASAD